MAIALPMAADGARSRGQVRAPLGAAAAAASEAALDGGEHAVTLAAGRGVPAILDLEGGSRIAMSPSHRAAGNLKRDAAVMFIDPHKTSE